MGEPILTQQPKKFNTELTDYSVSHGDKTGPYADNLEVDVLIVGAGFGQCPLDGCIVLTISTRILTT